MRDRIVVRGEAALRCLVMQLDEAIRTISKTTPFTQVFELTGAVEKDTPTRSSRYAVWNAASQPIIRCPAQ